MKETINFNQFCDAFERMGRKDQFTYKGKKALFEYLESYEEDAGQEVELDVIALCVEYTEYDGLEELQGDYPDIESVEELQEHTAVIPVKDGGLIIQTY